MRNKYSLSDLDQFAKSISRRQAILLRENKKFSKYGVKQLAENATEDYYDIDDYYSIDQTPITLGRKLTDVTKSGLDYDGYTEPDVDEESNTVISVSEEDLDCSFDDLLEEISDKLTESCDGNPNMLDTFDENGDGIISGDDVRDFFDTNDDDSENGNWTITIPNEISADISDTYNLNIVGLVQNVIDIHTTYQPDDETEDEDWDSSYEDKNTDDEDYDQEYENF